MRPALLLNSWRLILQPRRVVSLQHLAVQEPVNYETIQSGFSMLASTFSMFLLMPLELIAQAGSGGSYGG